MWIMVKNTTQHGLLYHAFEVEPTKGDSKHKRFGSIVEEPRLMMEAYDWCREHFGESYREEFQTELHLQSQNLGWYFWGKRVMIRDPAHALEFRLRWC